MQPPETSLSQSGPSNAAANGMWRLIGESLRGSRRDFTEESLGRAILLLAIPMVVEMIMESIFAVVDIFWVSKLGAEAVATVGLTESLLAILYALAMGLAMGAAALVARRTGEKDLAGAARAGGQALLLGVGLSVIIGVLGVVFASDLLTLLGASPHLVSRDAGYAQVMLGGSATILLLFLMNAIFRGAGDPALSMRTLWLANGINIVLGPCLVFGWGPFPTLGVKGAAVATTIGRGIGVLYQFHKLFRQGGRMSLQLSDLRIDRPTLATLVRVSRSGVFQVLIGTSSWVGLVRILAGFGSAALAGYTVAMRVVMFALLPSWGMSNAAATLVGQNLGAGRPDRAEQSVWRAALYNLVFLGCLGILLFVGADRVLGIFSADQEVTAYGAHCLRIVSAGFLFYAYGMVMAQAFNGAGDTRTPTLINLACFWVWEIPAAFLLAGPLGMGPSGVFYAIMTAFSLSAVLGIWLFRRGGWKQTRV